MAVVYLSSLFGAGAQLFTNQGLVLAGGSLNTYIAGSTTPQITFTDKTGTVSNGTQMLLDSAGRPSQEMWLPAGVSIKIIVLSSTAVQVGPTYDNIVGINDPSGGAPANAEWVTAGTPSFISPTQFSLVGDQRLLFPVGQRIRYTVTAGTGYGTVTAVVFGAVTTVTIQADSIPLDSGLSVVAYGLLNAANPSVSAQGVAYSSLAADTTVPSVGNALKRVDRAVALTTSTGSATALILTPTIPLSAYVTNAPLLVKFGVTAGANPTMNVSGLGALNLKQVNSAGTKVAAVFSSGQIAPIVYDGTDLVVLLPPAAVATPGRFLRLASFVSNGTWVKAGDVGSILIEGVGGGGGGGSLGPTPGDGGGGGGGGGYFKRFVTSPGATEAVTIGAGGGSGASGGVTSFGAWAQATGGGGGGGRQGGGGGGGISGDINGTGAPGGFGSPASDTGIGGNGGSSVISGGALGLPGAATGNSSGAGTGAGGAGATTVGGSGGSGRVTIYEYS